MNSKLRKACLQKAMVGNKYFKQGRSGSLWDRYRKARNHVTKLKAVSMNAYFSEKCNSDMFRKNPSNYWQTIKPFLTDRIESTDQNISLFHDNRVINDPVKVYNEFNDYFINAASDIGKEHPIHHDENMRTFFAHIRIIVLSDVLNLMFLKGVLSIFLLPLPRKFTTY